MTDNSEYIVGRRMARLLIATLSLGLAACSDAGEDTRITGTWVGYFELQSFDLTSDRLEIAITDVAQDGRITGTLTFGEPGPFPPAIDPAVGYPEEFGESLLGSGDVSLIESFPYTLAGSFDEPNRRLQADRDLYEVWSEWCDLQTPYAYEDEGEVEFRCLPSCVGTQSDDYCEFVESCELPGEVDCGKMKLCKGNKQVCECDADGCSVASRSSVTLDLHLEGDDLQGTLFGLGQAYLVRQ